jgi:hypothetical protein
MQNQNPGGIDFETAAARVTVEEKVLQPMDQELADELHEAAAGESLIIRPEWALVAVKGCFYPAAKWIHPAYEATDEEAQKAAPQMQAFLQTIADKYAPAMIARLANRHPEFWDLVAALGILYYQKWDAVTRIMAAEADAAERAKRVKGERVDGVTEMPLRSEQSEEKIAA